MKGFSTIRWFSREEVCNELAANYSQLHEFIDKLILDDVGDAHPKKMKELLTGHSEQLQAELALNLDMKPILTACYSLEGDGLAVLLARRKLDMLLKWGESLGQNASTLPKVAALLRARVTIEPGTKILEYFSDVQPPGWFEGVVITPRVAGKCTVKYSDNQKIDQDEHEVRPWIRVLDMPEWKRLSAAAASAIQYLRNRLTGNLPANQIHYDCSHMFQVLHTIQAFDPSWAIGNADADAVEALRVVKPLEDKIDGLQRDLPAYLTYAATAKIDHTENAEDHSFTEQILDFYRVYGKEFPAWAEAARIVFAFTPNSAGAERVFSMLNSTFGDQQTSALGDYIQSAIMLRYNKRIVG